MRTSLNVIVKSVLIAAGIIVICSMVKNHDNSTLTKICYHYIGENSQHPLSSDINNDENWEKMPETSIPNTCPGEDKLCSICFENTSTTFAQARAILIQYLSSNSLAALPDGAVINGSGSLSGKSVQVFQEQ